jgi:hypothetical protein
MDDAQHNTPDTLAAHLQALEAALQSQAVRADRAKLADLPAEDFCQRSISDFQARLLADDVALVTYRSQRHASGTLPASASLRSSLWKQRDGRWQMFFHQGTPIPG